MNISRNVRKRRFVDATYPVNQYIMRKILLLASTARHESYAEISADSFASSVSVARSDPRGHLKQEVQLADLTVHAPLLRQQDISRGYRMFEVSSYGIVPTIAKTKGSIAKKFDLELSSTQKGPPRKTVNSGMAKMLSTLVAKSWPINLLLGFVIVVSRGTICEWDGRPVIGACWDPDLKYGIVFGSLVLMEEGIAAS
ncbi:hypothetical protein CEXT_333021 [Caerostris extrusa]|uniref:Uncharacterized protein n=1 Tax=Caerostris extrusa TaxID=172846 RepID=A0AAV4TPQ1_CAEEX|nr:hypothetical protein CEXT_333021 [Caerostris extrusa]